MDHVQGGDAVESDLLAPAELLLPLLLKALAVALVGPELRPVAITTPSVARNRAFEDGSAATVSPVVVLRRCGTLVKSSEVSFW